MKRYLKHKFDGDLVEVDDVTFTGYLYRFGMKAELHVNNSKISRPMNDQWKYIISSIDSGGLSIWEEIDEREFVIHQI